MKIIYLTNDFPPLGWTSAGVLTFNLAKELQTRGHEILVVTTTQDVSKEGSYEYNGVRVKAIYTNYNIRWQSYLTLYNLRVISRFEKILEEFRPDIVHAQHIHRYISYYCLKIAKKFGAKVFLTSHDAMMINYGKWMPKNWECLYKVNVRDHIKNARKRYNPFRNMMIRHCLKYADKIFSVSDALKDVLRFNGIKNIETIHNGLNVKDWQVDLERNRVFKEKYRLQDKKVILFGGRLSGAKGGDQILKVVALIKKEIDNVVLLVAGERNEYVKKMEELIKRLDMERNVIFTGWLKGCDLKSAYNSVDVCAVPSVCLDPFPTINLEAMICKKPIVATCFGGSKEAVVNGKTGYIVNPYNIKDMANKIVDLLKNPEKAKKFGEAGYERVKKEFSLNNQANKTVELYSRFISF